MTRLPHELLVLGLPAENRERALHAVLAHVAGLTDVRVVDALVVVMSSGEVSETMEILSAATPGVIGQEDIAEIGSVLAPDGSAVAVLVEHVWATRLAAGLQTVNGRWVASVPIPADDVRAAETAAAGRGRALRDVADRATRLPRAAGEPDRPRGSARP
jgi:hypothetical protein